MVQTERDYVHSLQYVIENYIPELLRQDVPQVLRGKRNVIFGNIEKIYQFHSQFFLRELECCELNPYLVGHYFLRHVSISWCVLSVFRPFQETVKLTSYDDDSTINFLCKKRGVWDFFMFNTFH